MHIEGACPLTLPLASLDLVRMEHDGKFPEAFLQRALVDIDGQAEIIVRVARLLEIEVDFVDGEGKVGGVDADENLTAVTNEAERSWCGFGVAGTYEDCVEDALDPTCRLQHIQELAL